MIWVFSNISRSASWRRGLAWSGSRRIELLIGNKLRHRTRGYLSTGRDLTKEFIWRIISWRIKKCRKI